MSCENVGKSIATGVGGFFVVVAHPVVGIVAQPILAIKALVHRVMMNYHWRHTKDEKGIALCHPAHYKRKETKFTAEDLTRLEHEEQRILQRTEYLETLKWMKGLAKTIIPIIGLIWALFTLDMTDVKPRCRKCLNHERHWSDLEAIRWHIDQVKHELSSRDIRDITKN